MFRGGGAGRGGRGVSSLSRDQMQTLGVNANEMFSMPVTQPQPLFPPMQKKPQAFTSPVEQDYMLILKQDLTDRMRLSGSYLKVPRAKNEESLHEIDKFVVEFSSVKEKYNWNLFPSELRPKCFAKRITREKEIKPAEITAKLEKLEKLETNQNNDIDNDVEVKEEEFQEEESVEIEDEDEEMDDGIDYANNYFDNGEGYEDEDDNLDDDAIY